MLFTPSPKIYSFTCEPNIFDNVEELLYDFEIMALLFIVTVVKLVQPEKSILLGLDLLFGLPPLRLFCLKADSPIVVSVVQFCAFISST